MSSYLALTQARFHLFNKQKEYLMFRKLLVICTREKCEVKKISHLTSLIYAGLRDARQAHNEKAEPEAEKVKIDSIKHTNNSKESNYVELPKSFDIALQLIFQIASDGIQCYFGSHFLAVVFFSTFY